MNAASLQARLRGREARRFATFLATGGCAALVNVLSRLAFQTVTPYEVAIPLAYLVGMMTAFVLAKLFVFESTGRALHVEYGRFALVNVVALIQVWAVSEALARLALPALGWTWNAQTVAHVIGVLSPVLSSYYGHKRFSFA